MYKNIDIAVAQPLLQKALDLMATAACWENEAAKKAHIVGLQGEKRRLRYLYREADNIVTWTEHSVFDFIKDENGIGLDIKAKKGTIDVSTLRDPMSTMTGIINKLWFIYNEAHQLANDMVVAKLRPYSKRLYCYVDKLFDIINELQRAHAEYSMASYEYHHISRYQVSYYNVHDAYECKEEKQGYSDDIA